LLLGSIVLSCVLNGVFPLWIARKRGETNAWPNAAGIAALLLMFAALAQTHAGHWFFWPAVLLIDLVLIGIVLLHRNILLACAGMILTVLLTASWVVTLDPGHNAFGPLIVMCGF